jgi:two-component system response regulator NreC
MLKEEKLRLLLVDDHALVREGLHLVLSAQPDMEVVGEASNGSEAVDMVKHLRPDIVLMDITMPGMNGIEATRAIVALGPGVRVLGLTIHENPEYFFRMLAAGACGYVLKGATSAELVSAVRAVYRGGICISAAMASYMLAEHLRSRDAPKTGEDRLTARESEVLRAVARGLTNQEVADALHLSARTVESHRSNIMAKLGFTSRAQLVNFALRKGLLRSTD